MPFIPTAWSSMCSNINIINKTIVHSDTVLNLKDLGENVKVTEVSGISKDDLEKFLDIIFKNNKDVLFNTVQYSEEKKKVWIYADQILNTKCWEERNLRKYKYADPNNLIEYLKNIIEDPDAYTNKDSSSIIKPIPVSEDQKYVSIDTINKIQMRKTRRFYDKKRKLIDDFEKRFERIDGHSVSVSCFSPEFNYDKNTMNIEFKPRYSSDWYKIDFGKKDDDLYIVNSTYYEDDQILLNYADIFSKLYDLYASNKSYNATTLRDNVYNAKFKLWLLSNCFTLYLSSGKSLDISAYEKKYKLYGFNSQKEIAFVNENIDKIVKNLYFEVDKLPSYMKKMIKQERKKEEKKREELIRKKKEKEREAEKQRLLEEKRRLEEQKALEEKLRIKEEKKARRKAFAKKFNIFKKGN